jgi:S1-C subfamily serine protease
MGATSSSPELASYFSQLESPAIPKELDPYFPLGVTKAFVYSKFNNMKKPFFGRSLSWENPFVCNPNLHHREQSQSKQTEIVRAPRGEFYFVFAAVTQPVSKHCTKMVGGSNHSSIGTGFLVGVHKDLTQARETAAGVADSIKKHLAQKANERLQPTARTEKSIDKAPAAKPNAKIKDTDTDTDKKKVTKVLVNKDEAIPASSGTAFFVSNRGHLITNYHVIQFCQRAQIHLRGRIYDTTTIAIDRVNDLAVLGSNVQNAAFLNVGDEKPLLLEPIYVAGFPFGKSISSSLKVTKGIVSSLSGGGDDYARIQIDAAIQSGNSGGPIVNTKGNAVGIAVSTLDKLAYARKYGQIPESINFGVKGSVAGFLLEANQIGLTDPGSRDLTGPELGRLLSDSTVYLSCLMTRNQINELQETKSLFQEFSIEESK